MPYEIYEDNGKYCLRKKDGGESLGCHDSRDAAMAQMRAIYANEAVQENLVLSDADLGAGKRIVELDTSDPGFFTNCMADPEMVSRYGSEDQRARVCATLHKKITGITPAEHEAQQHNISAQALETFTNQRVTLSVLRITPADDKTGRSWEVVIIGPDTPSDLVAVEGVQYVRSKNGRYWSVAALEAAAPMFEGAKVYDNHLTDAEFQQRAGMRSPAREWLGSLVGVHWDRATACLKGTFKVVDDAFASKLIRAREGGVLDTIGLSIDVLRDFARKRIGESVAELVHKITRVFSVDAVGEPAAGGRFVRALESHKTQEAVNMEELMMQVEQLAAAIDASMLPDEVKAEMKAALEKAKGEAPVAQEQAPPGGEASAEEVQAEIAQVETTVEQSALPEPVKAEVVDQLEEVKTAIEEGATMEAVLKARRRVEAIQYIVKGQIRAHRRATRKVNMANQTQSNQAGLAEAQRVLEQANKALAEAKAESQRVIEAARIARCRHELDTALAESGIPESLRAVVRDQYEGRAFESKDLKAAIEKMRDAYLKAVDPQGNGSGVTGHGHRPQVRVGTSEADHFMLGFVRRVWGPTGLRKFADAFAMKWKDGAPVIAASAKEAIDDPSFAFAARAIEAWNTGGKSMSSVPLYSGLDEWYWDFTGGGDRNQADYFGEGRFSARALEANLTTSTLASVVKNAVNVLLAADYAVQEQWWSEIVEELDVDTYDTATLVRLFGVSALSVVNEGAGYTELDWEDEEETATAVKRGNYVEITLETFLRDKIKKLDTLPQRLSKAWHNTVADRVAQVFTTNSAAGPVLSDSGALFNATAATSAGGHANLLTTALSYTALDAVVTAMKKQTDQPLGAGRRLGSEVMPTHLLVPIDLTTTAQRIVDTEKLPGSANNDDNPHYKKYTVLEVPVWTDANDWAMLAKPGGVSPIKLIWLRGKRTPELFEAADESTGALLSNDAIRYKVRQFGFEFSSTYRVAPVADWRSLHKSNVT